MKKVLALLVSLIPLMVSAQHFTLTPYGFLSSVDSATPYIVVEMQGTKGELFSKAKTSVTSMWKSSKDVMSFNEPDIIVVNGFSSTAAHFKKMGEHCLDMHYRLEIKFKDGKIRIDAPVVTDLSHNHKVDWSLGMGGSGMWGGTCHLYDENGKCRYNDLKQNLENYFNMLIDNLISSIQSGGVGDDW